MLKRILSIMLLGGVLFMTSCDKEDETDNNGGNSDTTATGDSTGTGTDTLAIGGSDSESVSNATVLIQQTATSLNDEATALSESEGMNAVMDFMELMNEGRYSSRSLYKNGNFAQDIISIMASNFTPQIRMGIDSLEGDSTWIGEEDDHHEDDDFDPSDMEGYTFTWNSDSSQWDYDSIGHTKVIFNFPTEGSSSNNATMTLHKWETTDVVNVDSCWDYMTEEYFECIDTMEQPTELEADMVVSGVKVVDLDLSVDYDEEGEPTMIDADITVNQFNLDGTISRTSSAVSADIAFSKNSNEIFGVEGNLTISENMDEDEMPESISANVHMFGIALDVSANDLGTTFETMDESSDMTMDSAINYINNRIDAELYTYPGNVKIGEFVMVKTDSVDDFGDTIPALHILFNDGTTRDAEEYLAPLQETIEDWFCDTFGGDDC